MLKLLLLVFLGPVLGTDGVWLEVKIERLPGLDGMKLAELISVATRRKRLGSLWWSGLLARAWGVYSVFIRPGCRF